MIQARGYSLLLLCFCCSSTLACEAVSVTLDPPSDAGSSRDASRWRDDAKADAGDPDVGHDSGPRLFTARVGAVYGPDPESFVPTDLSSYRLSARSALGSSTPTIDGPGRLSVWAQGRLELTVASPLRFDTAIVVSTEANYVDISWPGHPPGDSPPIPKLNLALELSSPWSSSDRLRVRTSGGWAAFRLTGRFVVGETSVPDVVVENLGGGRLLSEDLWVVRERSELSDAGTIARRVDQAVVRLLDRDIASRGVAVRLSSPDGRLPAASWDVSAWKPDGVSEPDPTSVVRYFVRADRFDAAYPATCGSWPTLTDVAFVGERLEGTLPEGA
jgi:hypothetical protein